MRRAAVLLFAFAAMACKVEAPKVETKIVAPTEEESRRYVEQFIEAVSKPNVVRASAMIDWDALLERATSDTEAQPGFRTNFIKGAKKSAHESAYAKQMAQLVERGGDLRLLRVRSKGDERTAILRVLLAEGGVNYHEMLLTRDKAGFVRAVDVYNYATGEQVSETVKRLYRSAASQQTTPLQRLAGKNDDAMVQEARMYKEMNEKVMAGKAAEAMAFYKRMPEKLKSERIMMVAYASACASIDDEEYAAALDRLRAKFPNDPGLDLMLIDGYFLKEKYDESLQAIDRLDQRLGGDPYLDVLRANTLVKKGDLGRARAAAMRAAMNEPTLADSQWALVTVSLADKDFDETARLLTRLEGEYDVEIGDLTTVPEYAEFVKSEAYARWFASH